MSMPLPERQREILCRVVEEYVATGQPVGSKTLVERAGVLVSPSTVRAELAELERLGLLTHPHTSAGRVPTEAGYRVYVDGLLARQEPRPAEFPLGLAVARAEVEEALQTTTEMLSQVTRLLALVSAPPLQAATVRHVDVLQLQPNVVMVVVITSTGGVSKQRYAFVERVDPGLVTWAGDYLRERVTGARLPGGDPRRVRCGRGRAPALRRRRGRAARRPALGGDRRLSQPDRRAREACRAARRPRPVVPRAPRVRPCRRRARAVRPARPRARRSHLRPRDRD